MKRYTLITGASHGIGRSMAFECARRGQDLILVALPDDLLNGTVNALKTQYSVDIRSFGVDLCQEEAASEVYKFCIENELQVDILINNAGIGDGGLFEAIPIEKYWKMIDLNIRSMTSMTYCFLPMLRQSDDAHILNMSSMEAFLPLPYKAVYAGTKNYIYAFSLTINQELKHDNCHIKVTAVCPGPVITNEEGLKRIKTQGKSAKLLVMMPDDVARIAIKKMLAGKSVVSPGKMNWTLVRVARLFPMAWKMKILEKLFREYKYHHDPAGK